MKMHFVIDLVHCERNLTTTKQNTQKAFRRQSRTQWFYIDCINILMSNL